MGTQVFICDLNLDFGFWYQLLSCRFINFLKNYTSDSIDIAFSSERSIQDAIEELSQTEASTVIVSYTVMFLYVSIALGKFISFRTILVSHPLSLSEWRISHKILIAQVHSKILLALGGIVVVISSVACSLGIFGYVGLATTMLTIEVIPFLVLAVGVDNLFILVHTYNRLDKTQYTSVSESIADALGQVGPSILLTSMSEAACFAVGSVTDMPAVKTFALYATVAILFNFLLQITAFVAFMALDQNRYDAGLLDLLCCIHTNKPETIQTPLNGFLQRVFEKFYTPFILRQWVFPIFGILWLKDFL